METKVIKVNITDENGILLDSATLNVDKMHNMITILSHPSEDGPNVYIHWNGELIIGKGDTKDEQVP